MDSLTLNYEPDLEDCVGQLFARVRTASFSGYGFVWAQPGDLEAFATQLGAYPLSANNPAAFRWGYNACEGEDLILSIEIKPADGVGNLLVLVEIADMYDPQERVRTSFRTTYSDLQAFQSALLPIVAGGEARATLLGHR